MEPCIPTFHSKLKILKDPSNILAYILQRYLTVPSRYLETHSKEEISLANDVANRGYDVDSMRDQVVSSLTSVISRYYPVRESLDVDVVMVDSDTNEVDKSVKINIILTLEGKIYYADATTLIRLKGVTS